MSLELSNIEKEMFLSDVHVEFKAKGFHLEDAVRVKTGTSGSIVHFPVFGNGIANQKAPQDDVTPLNITNRDVQVTMEDWYAPEYVDRSFINKIAVNATQEYVQLCSQALARRADQQIVTAIVGANYGGGAGQGNSIAAGGTAFTYTKFLQAHGFLRAAGAAYGDVYCVMNSGGEEDILAQSQLTSSDFVNQKALAGNGIDGMTIMGVNFKVLPNMDEGGLGGSNIAYMFNKQAVGYAQTERLGGDISWENVKSSYLINMWMEAAAAVIDATGMVEINYA
jgi:Phage capsid protein